MENLLGAHLADHHEVKNTEYKTRKKIAKTHDPKHKFVGVKLELLLSQGKLVKKGDLEIEIRGKFKMHTVFVVNEALVWFDLGAHKRAEGFLFLWGDTTAILDTKPESQGRVFSILSHTEEEIVFRAESFKDAALWLQMVREQASRANAALHKDALEFWDFAGTSLDQGSHLEMLHRHEFSEMFMRFLSSCRGIHSVTSRNLDVMWVLLQSIPLMIAELPKGVHKEDVVTLDQLCAFSSAFGWLSRAYNEYDEVIHWYVGVATAEELDERNLWDIPVHAYHFVIRLVPKSSHSAQLVITYTDFLLHQLHKRVHVFPLSSRFELEGTGEVYETLQDLVESHSRLTYCVADNVFEFRRLQKEKQTRADPRRSKH